MTPTLTADAVSNAPANGTATRGGITISLQARIAMTVGLDTYENKLTAAMHIANAELLIARTRLVLGGAMSHLDGPGAKDQIQHASDFFQQSDDWWKKFVEQPHEAGETPLIRTADEKREAMRRAMTAFIDALKAGDREAADRIGTSQLSPLFNDMSAANEQVKRTLYANAKRSYDEAEAFFRVFFTASTTMIAIGTIAALFSWIALRRAIMAPLGDALGHFSAIAAGDLSRHIEIRRADEMGRLLRGLDTMQTQLAATVRAVRGSCESIASATREIATGTMDLSSRTEEQAASLEETAASMSELTATVRQNADNAQQAQRLADNATTIADSGNGVIGRVVDTMSRIDASSRKIADITGIIEGIAFQTNILALNAAVEAARAGEQGRGFAVVASEVRGLAQHSSTAAKQISELIAESVSATAAGTELVAESGRTMQEVLVAVRRVAGMMNEIVAAAEEQRIGIEQVDTAIDLMDSITQQNAALVEQASAAAQALDQQSQNLREQMSAFRVA